MAEQREGATYTELLNARLWNLDAMERARKEGRERDAWRHSDNAEKALQQMLAQPQSRGQQ